RQKAFKACCDKALACVNAYAAPQFERSGISLASMIATSAVYDDRLVSAVAQGEGDALSDRLVARCAAYRPCDSVSDFPLRTHSHRGHCDRIFSAEPRLSAVHCKGGDCAWIDAQSPHCFPASGSASLLFQRAENAFFERGIVVSEM